MKIRLSSRKLFLIDGVGALLTAVLTGLVLPSFESYVGLPLVALRALGIVAFMFSIYSFLNFHFFSPNWPRYLAAIAVANTLYSIVSLAVVFYFRESVTTLGILYFASETIVIAILVAVEWRTSEARAQ